MTKSLRMDFKKAVASGLAVVAQSPMPQQRQTPTRAFPRDNGKPKDAKAGTALGHHVSAKSFLSTLR